MTNFRDDWTTLGYPTPRRPRRPEGKTSELNGVVDWVNGIGTDDRAWLAVQGPTVWDRAALYVSASKGPWHLEYKEARAWLKTNPLADLLERITKIQVSPDFQGKVPTVTEWEWLWGLVHLEDFYIEEPLRGMSAQGPYLVHSAIKLLLEVRFRIQEGHSDKDVGFAFQTLTDWMTGQPLTPEQIALVAEVQGSKLAPRQLQVLSERIDMLVFFLTLAEQNGVISKVVLVWDDLETAVRNGSRASLTVMRQILEAVTRWARNMEIPLAFMLGVDAAKVQSIKRLNTRLGCMISENLAPI